ncbi:MAG: hypothetical protein L0Y36_04235 [Planctomycetales bacterium]|nr:hypothetical protein [Planctomycetales bacterium]
MDKRMRWVVLMVISLSVTAMAIDFMGPPTATLKKGQWRTDFTYHFSENDIELTNITIEGFNLGDLDVDEIEIQRYYATFGYGLDDRWEIYAKIGGADLEQDDISFSSDADLAYGWGTRITMNQSKEVDWGVGFLMSWFGADEDYSGSSESDTYKTSFDIDAYELQVAAGPTFKMQGWDLYGGIFYYMLEGDIDAKETGTDGGVPYSLTGTADMEEDSNVGGYVGTLMHLTKNIDAMVELAFVSDGWGVGGGIGWKF